MGESMKCPFRFEETAKSVIYPTKQDEKSVQITTRTITHPECYMEKCMAYNQTTNPEAFKCLMMTTKKHVKL